MKIIVFSLCCLFYFVTHATAGGEYYQYVDDSGIKHFTENYAEVPDQYKPQIKIHKEISTPETKPQQKPEQQSDKNSTSVSAESLIIQKDDLDKEYNVIIEKRKILTLKKDTIGQIEYNQQAAQLNTDIQAYQVKSNAYEQLVEEYNKQINTTKPQLPEESEKP